MLVFRHIGKSPHSCSTKTEKRKPARGQFASQQGANYRPRGRKILLSACKNQTKMPVTRSYTNANLPISSRDNKICWRCLLPARRRESEKYKHHLSDRAATTAAPMMMLLLLVNYKQGNIAMLRGCASEWEQVKCPGQQQLYNALPLLIHLTMRLLSWARCAH